MLQVRRLVREKWAFRRSAHSGSSRPVREQSDFFGCLVRAVRFPDFPFQFELFVHFRRRGPSGGYCRFLFVMRFLEFRIPRIRRNNRLREAGSDNEIFFLEVRHPFFLTS